MYLELCALLKQTNKKNCLVACNGDGIELILNYLRLELKVFITSKDQSQDQTGDFIKLKLKLRLKIPLEIKN
jgi:hypothetical protein